MFEKLKAKIGAMHSSHPLAKQRAEFLALNPNTPVEKKAHYTHNIVGAAAAYEAWQLFQSHDAHARYKNGLEAKITHARSKDIIIGLAEGRVVKLVEEKRLPFTSEKEKVKFIGLAQKDAVRDAKLALRDSGFFEAHELQPIDADERAASKIL